MRTSLPPVDVANPARSTWARIVDLLAVLALLALAGWWFAAPAELPPLGRSLILLLGLAAALVGWSSRRAPSCWLRWDGRQWLLVAAERTDAGALTPGKLRVIVDLQFAMLLRFESGAGRGVSLVRWFAVDCRGRQSDWHLLRCAAFASQHGETLVAPVQRREMPQ
ncbi:hypothetical protein [Piscinibacter sakaiensis]|uniref:hypothetical protein n=1 Tax=Piscinibacter sakaiensis TaxID=1547922 RepID=UPI003AAE02E9